MRILFISHSFEMGGVEKLIADLSSELKKRGHETRRIALFVKGSLYNERDSKCLAPLIFDVEFVRRIKFLFYPIFLILSPIILWRLRKEIVAFKPDVLHLNMWGADIFGSIVGKSLGIRMVSTQHDEVKIGLFLRLLKSISLKKINVVVAISRSVNNFLIAYFGVPRKKIHCIYNSVNLDKFKKCRKSDNDWGPIIGSVGRLAKIKGHMFMLSAIKELKDIGIEIPKVIFVGGGAEEKAMEEFITSNGLQNIIITGEVPNVTDYLQKMDVFILPSLSEGLSIALIEALAAGKLIIATDVGGVRDIILDDKIGIIIPPADPTTLADKLMNIIKDKDKYLEFRRKAAELADNGVLKRFDLREMVSAYEEVYKG